MMPVRYLYLVVLCSFISMNTTGLSGEIKHANETRQLIDRQMELNANDGSIAANDLSGPQPILRSGNALRALVGETGYDYFTNTVSGRTVFHICDEKIVVAFMKRLNSVTDPRNVVVNLADNSLGLMWGEQIVGTAEGATGWPRLARGHDNTVLLGAHGGGIDLFEITCDFAFSTFHEDVGDGFFPALATNLDDNTIHLLYNSADVTFEPDSYARSQDYGVSWAEMSFPENCLGAEFTPGNTEVWPIVNPTNSQEISFSSSSPDPEDFPDEAGTLCWYKSEDGGETWSANILHTEGNWISRGDESVDYFVNNFSQNNTMYDDDGNFHLAFNGFGASALNGDTVNITPVVYWNSTDQEFIELSAPEVGHKLDQVYADDVIVNRPGNGLGCAYPSLAMADNGCIAVVWQQPEIGDDGMPVYGLDIDGNPALYYSTDIWSAVSCDGGSTWTDPIFVAGEPGQSDVYPQVAREVNIIDDSLYVDVMYFIDADPGVAIFATPQGQFAHGEWWYERKALAHIDEIMDIRPGGGETIVSTISLTQNYPNPFNPNTVFSLQLAVSSDISLVVYDLNGREVRSLASNRQLAAGSHQFYWDGTDSNGVQVASGTYFYRVQSADGFAQTQKMVLVR